MISRTNINLLLIGGLVIIAGAAGLGVASRFTDNLSESIGDNLASFGIGIGKGVGEGVAEAGGAVFDNIVDHLGIPAASAIVDMSGSESLRKGFFQPSLTGHEIDPNKYGNLSPQALSFNGRKIRITDQSPPTLTQERINKAMGVTLLPSGRIVHTPQEDATGTSYPPQVDILEGGMQSRLYELWNTGY